MYYDTKIQKKRKLKGSYIYFKYTAKSQFFTYISKAILPCDLKILKCMIASAY